MNKSDLIELKTRFPLPLLMEHLGLGAYAKASCKSPLRADQNASWGIYESRGLYRWKDFGTDQGGDEIDFLAGYLRLDAKKYFPVLVNLYSALADNPRPGVKVPLATEPKVPPSREGFTHGTSEQLGQLSALRGISVEALAWAQARGVLVFGNWNGMEVFGLSDQSGKLIEIRRLDKAPFPETDSLSERKSHALKGSQKSWPVGIHESVPYPYLALVEGVPDFLAAHDFALREQAADKARPEVRCVPVAMLAASVRIDEDALQLFAKKTTYIYPHADEDGTGLVAAARWQAQIKSVGGKVVLFDMSRVQSLTKRTVKDLNDLLKLKDPELFAQNPGLLKILPDHV